MRALLGFVAMLLMAIAGLHALARCSPGAVDQEFRSAAEGFAIRFPARPQSLGTKVSMPQGLVDAWTHTASQGERRVKIRLRFGRILQGPETAIGYIVSSQPLRLPSDMNPMQVATTATADYLQRSQGRQLAQRPVTVRGSGQFGLETLMLTGEGQYQEVMRVFFVNGRIYQLHAVLPAQPMGWQDSNATQFLESFSIL